MLSKGKISMKKRFYKLGAIATITSILSVGLTASLHALEATTVEIDLDTQQYIGDISELDRSKFFNLHSRAGDPASTEVDALYLRNELNIRYGRIFWGPMAAAGTSDYPSTEAAMRDGPNAIANALSHPLADFADKRTVYTEHPASVLREGNDPVDGSRWAADYFSYYFNDDTRPLFYEPMNEPFVHASDYVDGPWDPEANAQVRLHMANWFSEIGQAFDARGLSTKVIGFSSAWPSFEISDFDLWTTNQKMFMDVAGDNMDGFSFHLYDGVNVLGQDNIRSGANAEAIIDMIEAYSFIKWGEIKPHAVTEYGGIVDGYPLEYSAEKSSQELRSYNHILFSLLEREDRLLTSTPFVTGMSRWFYENNEFQPYSAAIFRPDPDKIVGNKVTGFLVTEKAKFYQLWSEVKGSRVATKNDDPDLAVQAFKYGHKLYLALNNYEDDNKTVALNFLSMPSAPQSIRIKRLNVPYGEAAMYSDEVLAQAPTNITMAGHETIVLEYQFSQLINPAKLLRTNTYYADDYLQPIIENQSVNFAINNVAVQQQVLTFADAVAKNINFDQALADAIPANMERRMIATMRTFERSFQRIVAKYPDTWEQSRDYQRLVTRAMRSSASQQALMAHYAEHGYNDMQTTATIKMGIGRKHEKSKQPELSVNGHLVEVPNDWRGYDQAQRSDFFGTIEIDVPAKFLKQNNQVKLTFPDSQGHVSSLIVEVESTEDNFSIPVSDVVMQQHNVLMNIDKPYRLMVDVLPFNATNKALNWSSSNEAVAIVEDSIVTPISPGIVEITATSIDGEFSASTLVEVRDQLTIRNTLAITNDVSYLEPTDQITLDIDYSSNVARDIFFEVYSPTNQWLGATRQTVNQGNGSVSLHLTFPEELSSGTGYRITASLLAVNGDWRTGVDSHTINDIEIASDIIVDEPDPNDLLLGNGSFERGNIGSFKLVYGSVGTVEASSDAAKEGNYGVKLDTSNGRVGIQIDEDVLPEGLVASGRSFKLSFYMKRVTAGGWAGGFAHFTNLNGGYKATTQGPWHGTTTSDQWILVEKEIEGVDWPNTGTFIELNMITSGQIWYLDDIKLIETTPEPENLFGENAGFEMGALAPWGTVFGTLGSMEVLPEAALDGNYGLRIDTSNGRAGILMDDSILPFDVMSLGKKYKLSFYMRRAAGNGWAGGFAHFTNNVNGYVATPQGPWHGTTTSGEWILVEKEIDGQEWPNTGTFIEINMMTTGQLWDVDSFMLEDISSQ
jgi:hypothetical protein